MSCCCQKVYKLCDVTVCVESLRLPIIAEVGGDHVLELEFLGDVVRQTSFFGINDGASFGTNALNEGFTYVGHVLDPNNQKMLFTVDGVEYDCFEFTTRRLLQTIAV